MPNLLYLPDWTVTDYEIDNPTTTAEQLRTLYNKFQETTAEAKITIRLFNAMKTEAIALAATLIDASDR